MTELKHFPKLWKSTYWFPSNTSVTDEPSTYSMKSYVDGDVLVFESVPNEEGSYMFMRLNILDDIATGTWHETTAPDGEFKGAQYSGSGQLMINPESYDMEGMWVGAGYDKKLKCMRIYSGNWTIEALDALEEVEGQ